MSSNKKNQHFLPKLYLRNFSIHNNRKQIGLYNLKNYIFSDKAPIKNQGSRDYYYGMDGIIEDGLANIENIIAPSIGRLLKNGLPYKSKEDKHNLMYFLVLTDLRNPTMINYPQQVKIELRKILKESHPNGRLEPEILEDITHGQSVYMALSQVNKTVPYLNDLKYKLLINETQLSFITSDYPVIKYNQYLESRRYMGGKTAYGCVGLQIFLPLSCNIVLMLYDPKIYRVGDNRKNYLRINQTQDIDQINTLQLLNCSETLYFDENISQSYISGLIEKSKSFKRANILEPKVFGAYGNNIEGGQYISTGTSDCQTDLRLTGIKLRSGVNYIPLPKGYTYLRETPLLLREKMRRDDRS